MWMLTIIIGYVGQNPCIDFSISREKFMITLRSHLDVTCSCYFWSSLLALFVGHGLHINFSVSIANLLTTLRSHLNVTGSC